MTHAFDSEVSLHYWFLLPTVRRPPDFYYLLWQQQEKNIKKRFYHDGPDNYVNRQG